MSSDAQSGLLYPTRSHAETAEAAVGFFSDRPEVDAVILAGSCARGKASPNSCVDLLVLVPPDVAPVRRQRLEEGWLDFHDREPVFQKLQLVGKYSHVDLNFIDGVFKPGTRGWTGGPDEFELEIGNALVHGVPLFEGTNYLDRLKARWLPYYGDALRRERLAVVRRHAMSNLDHVSLNVDRGLHFQAFHRLYDAFREFLQALFITRRVYPIAYNQWVREQVAESLGLPELYDKLTHLLEIDRLESTRVVEKAEVLRGLYERHVRE